MRRGSTLDRLPFDQNHRPFRAPSWEELDRIVREEFPQMDPSEFIVADVQDKNQEEYRRDLGQMLKVLVDYRRIYGFHLDGFRPFSAEDMALIKTVYVDGLGQPAEDYENLPAFGIFTDNETSRVTDDIFGGKQYLVYNPDALPHREYAGLDAQETERENFWNGIYIPAAEMFPSTQQTIAEQVRRLNSYRMDLVDGTADPNSRFAKLSEHGRKQLAGFYQSDLDLCADSDAAVTGQHLDEVRKLTCNLTHEIGHLIIQSEAFGRESYDDILRELESLTPPTEYARVSQDEKFAELMASLALGIPKPEFKELLEKFGLPAAPEGYVRFDASQ
jgi:hypothetical protein